MLEILMLIVVLGCLAAATAPATVDPRYLGVIDVQLALQAAAVTKTASFNGAPLDLRANGIDQPPAGLPCQFAIPVSAADFSSTDETYTFHLEESLDQITWRPASPARSVLSTNVGGNSIFINGTVGQVRYVRLVLTIAGTTPSITYGPVYLVPRGGR